jgi:nickel-dependent lactate racemase
VQVNRLLVEENWDLILSVGQVVPHEVVGMANHNKNVFVGTGGPEGINKSHYIGAVFGMERMMGRADTPVRRLFDYASENYGKDLPVFYVLTVVGADGLRNRTVRGVFFGAGKDCFLQASKLALEANFTMLEEPLSKVVVYLDPGEFKSTWLGNKSIYRTRMAMADNGELIVLAPGLVEFGEDREIDKLIRKYGYRTTPEILDFVDKNEDIRNNLSAAAHLIHGTSEGRFKIRYCPGKNPGNLSRKEIESVGFEWGDLDEYLGLYPILELDDGYNRARDGKEFYSISNPAMGLWTSKERFE